MNTAKRLQSVARPKYALDEPRSWGQAYLNSPCVLRYPTAMARTWFGLVFLMILTAAAAEAQQGTADYYFNYTVTGSGFGLPYTSTATYEPDPKAPVSQDSALVGTGGTIPIQWFGMDNWPTFTKISIQLQDSQGDALLFKDYSPAFSTSPPGRSGTATLLFGTGLLHYAVGSVTYTFSCTKSPSNCGANGNTIADNFDFLAQGHIHLNVPDTTTSALSASLKVAPGPGYGSLTEAWENNQAARMGGKPNVDNPISKAVLRGLAHAASTSTATPVDTLGIALPLELTDTTYTASATCPNLPTNCWVTIPNSSGAVPALTSATVTADLGDGANLNPGVYPAEVSVTVSPSGGTPVSVNVPTVLIMTSGAPILQLSETEIQFQALAAASQSPQAHAITLSSTGAAIPYTATASTSGGGNWLSVTPASGSVPSSTSSPSLSTVNISASPAGLAAGTYFGRVDISAPSALSPVQSVPVVLTVNPATATAITLSTTGLVFTTAQFTNPAPQTVTVSTFSSAPITLDIGSNAGPSGTWLAVSGSATAVQTGQPVTATVSINTAGLTPGSYTGTVYVQVPSGTEYSIAVALIVTPAGGACTPTKLIPILQTLGMDFEVPAGLPVSLQAQIVDDCGAPLTSGAVQASFSSANASATVDSPVTMLPAGNGLWTGTWEPHGIMGDQPSLLIGAQSTSGLVGSTVLAGTLDANPAATVITPGGVVSAASLAPLAPVSPGGFISIFGSNLASATATSLGYPYVTSLGGTQVLLNGQSLPLEFVSAGQINALVPYETPVNGIQELLVQQNGGYSLPETLIVATASPAVFTQSQSGTGAGAIVVAKANGTRFVASPAQPASAGDALEIYCTGLGAVSPAVADGAAAPLTPPLAQTTNPVTVTSGGRTRRCCSRGLRPATRDYTRWMPSYPPALRAPMCRSS